MNTLEKLEADKREAWIEYEKLTIPAKAALKKYEAAQKAHTEAALYEKAKRQVMRDLLRAV